MATQPDGGAERVSRPPVAPSHLPYNAVIGVAAWRSTSPEGDDMMSARHLRLLSVIATLVGLLCGGAACGSSAGRSASTSVASSVLPNPSTSTETPPPTLGSVARPSRRAASPGPARTRAPEASPVAPTAEDLSEPSVGYDFIEPGLPPLDSCGDQAVSSHAEYAFYWHRERLDLPARRADGQDSSRQALRNDQ